MIPYSGWKFFLAQAIIANANNLKAVLIDDDFDDEDREIEYDDLSIADVPGIDPQIYEPTTDPPTITADPYGQVLSATFTFQPDGITVEEFTIYGVALYHEVAEVKTLIVAHKFDAPILLNNDAQKIERGIDFFDREFVP
jgi:hypothetical protein